MSRYTQAVLGQLDRLFGRGTVAGLSEGTLLERFVAAHDEAAMAALVARHGPMVLGVCRRLLRDEHDVEDAFQATFLVLVRRAAAIRDGERVGAWLHGVAHRVAVRARANAARRHAREPAGDVLIQTALAPPAAEASLRELHAVIDDELARLPDSMRAPLVLCYLEGLTHDEAAQRLGWPVGTVRSRMARARDRLRGRLTRRGLEGDEAALTAALATQPVSSVLIDATVKASLGFASPKAAAAVASAAAAALAEGVTNAMMLAKLKVLGAAALVCMVAVAGVQTYAFQNDGKGNAQAAGQPSPPIDGNPAGVLRKLDLLQAELARSARRNAELQKEVQDLRAELEALRPPQPASGKKARPDEQAQANDPNAVEESEGRLAPISNPPYEHVGRDLLLLISPQGDRVVAYDTNTKKARSLRLSEDKKNSRQVTIIAGPQILALMLKGPKITRVAVLDIGTRTWYPMDLREPVDVALPTVGPGWVEYIIGRRHYLFNMPWKRWIVVEPPEGVNANLMRSPNGSYTCEHNGHIYTFDKNTGKWDDLDTKAILNAPEETDDVKPEPK